MGTGIIVAGLVGAGIALQVAVLGRSSAEANPLSVSLALQLAGVIGAAVWATLRSEWRIVFDISLRWWWLPLGLGGWILVAALGFASDRVGVATTLAVSIGAQLIVGLIIERALGERALGISPIVGVVLILAGAVVVASGS